MQRVMTAIRGVVSDLGGRAQPVATNETWLEVGGFAACNIERPGQRFPLSRLAPAVTSQLHR